ncbi:hypothetical protein CWIS_12655 [Cellulomonas sp. A375-1]|uniref:Uncharacterized protein n=2 Tax=Cellulomonas TaxID=1707 RepID=A0A4Y3KR07_9CELL|nr:MULTISPECIES: hypothetical protein [Cellulomonas]KMM45092.1 hypothetical protein CWIS_12655 [Cellulomonas sp. A375-1]GEA86026.1 hypothetical protein CGE01nite_32770 [Cellulomonas gelida]GGL33737.1 hypothetical protein GCM10009774_25310 [Cellulomonas gelida]
MTAAPGESYTDAAPDVPLVQPRRAARRVGAWAATTVAVVAVALTAWLILRTVPDGPLEGSDDAGVVVDAFPAGSWVTFGLQDLTNPGDEDIIIEHVEVLFGDVPVEVAEQIDAIGAERVDQRGYNLFDVADGWPRPAGKPVEGMTIDAGDSIGLELYIGVKVPDARVGIGTLAGVRVKYRAAGVRYGKTFRTELTICPLGSAAKCDAYEPPRTE